MFMLTKTQRSGWKGMGESMVGGGGVVGGVLSGVEVGW